MVLKKNGRRELFDRGKLLNGLLRSCDKRTVPMSVMEQVVNDVERDIRNEINQEVTTDRIGELVLQTIKKISTKLHTFALLAYIVSLIILIALWKN